VASDQGTFLFFWLGLVHMRHLVLLASLDNCVDDGFGDHLDAMKICS